ncbi:MAG: hypothetical protein QME42_08160 [bacterium]|nr:hypothetical protein [bacterium]
MEHKGCSEPKVEIDYWQLFQSKGDKLLVLLGKPKKSEIKKVALRFLIIIITTLSILFFLTSTQITMTSKGYTVSQLQKQMHQMENVQRMLLVELSSLEASERIEGISTQMGLYIPEGVEIVYLPQPESLVQEENKGVFHKLVAMFFKTKKAEASVISD